MFLNPSLDLWKPTCCFLALQYLPVGLDEITEVAEIPVSSSHSFITLYPHSGCMRSKLHATMNIGHSIMVPLTFAFSIQPQEFLAWVAQLQYGSWRECPAKKSEHCLRCSESEVFIPEGNLVPRPMAPAQEHCCPTSLPFQTKQWAQLCPFKGIAGNYPWRPSHFNGTQGGTCSRLCLGLGYAAGVQKHSCGEKNPKW